MHVTKYTSALKFYREYSSAASAKIDIRQALQIQRSTPAKIPFQTLSHEHGFLRSVTTHTEGPTDVFFLLLFPIPSPLVWTNTFFDKELFFFTIQLFTIVYQGPLRLLAVWDWVKITTAEDRIVYNSVEFACLVFPSRSQYSTCPHPRKEQQLKGRQRRMTRATMSLAKR